ncbi:MAG: ATP-binding protein [Bdellovibrionales bacterium]
MQLNKQRILIVDDKDSDLHSLEGALEPLGVTIDKATTGPQAVEMVSLIDYSVVLLDMQISGMDGYETAKAMLALKVPRHPPIIFVTAINSEEQYVLKGYNAGCVDYILKPLNSDLVRNKVRFCMDLHLRVLENEALIKKLRSSETELKRSNEELQQFAYVASHDLQEPIRMVRNYIQLFAKKYSGQIDEKADKYINYALEGAERMQDLIDDLLLLSRVNKRGGDLQLTEVREVLVSVLRDLKILVEESGAKIEYGDLPVVMADKIQLRQVFQNLISNAIKFRGEAEPLIKIGVERKGSFFQFSVADNGIGISKKYFDQIFVIFQRLHARDKHPGSGIGLALCKKIIERHEGQLWVESEENKGSTFFFTIPIDRMEKS